MLEDARAGKFQLIVTKEVSRFSRNLLDAIACTRALREIGVGVLFVTDGICTMDPDAELRLSIMASIAQEESRRTSSRVTWGQTRQMEKGVVFGPSLLGYDVKDGKLTINPKGAELVRMIFQLYAVEQVSTSRIAALLRKRTAHAGKQASRWTAQKVLRILKNEKYVGDLIQKKTYTPDFLTHQKKTNHGQVPQIILKNHHEAIISREVWELAQQRLQKNRRRKKPQGGCSTYYGFSGKIRCGECGATFVSRIKYRKDGSSYRRFGCLTAIREGSVIQNGSDGQRGCNVGRLVREDDAWHMLITALRSLPLDTGALVEKTAALAWSAMEFCDNPATKGQKTEQEFLRIQQKKERMLDSYFSGTITLEEMQALKARYQRQLEQLQKQQTEAASSPPVSREQLQQAVRSILTGKTESEAFCRQMVEEITVFRNRQTALKLTCLPLTFWFSAP